MSKHSTRAITGAVVALLAAASAHADAPPKAKKSKTTIVREEPARIVPEVSWPSIWHGFYAGVSVGVGRGSSSHTYDRNDNHGTAEQSLSGALGSVTVGYNYQFTPLIVGGLEADLGVMDLSADDKVIFDGHIWKSQFGPMWGTIRGRLGYLFGQRTLVYYTGGLAFMSVDEIGIGDAAGQTATNQSTRSGFVMGAGVEHALSERLTAKVEFLHMDFGSHNGLSENREAYSFENSVNLIRAGVNMRF